MRFESKGLTPEEIDAPETVFRMPKERKPGRALATSWSVRGCEDPPHHFFIERERKGLGYLISNFDAPKVGIPPFHLQYQFNQVLGRALRAGLLAVRG